MYNILHFWPPWHRNLHYKKSSIPKIIFEICQSNKYTKCSYNCFQNYSISHCSQSRKQSKSHSKISQKYSQSKQSSRKQCLSSTLMSTQNSTKQQQHNSKSTRIYTISQSCRHHYSKKFHPFTKYIFISKTFFW